MDCRALVEGDIPAIAGIHRRACLIAYSFLNWAFTLDEVREWYDERFWEWDWGRVALVGGVPVAYIATYGAHVDHLFVDPAHQRRGIGDALMAAALERSPPATSLMVFERNLPARAFYRRHGFVEASRFVNRKAGAVELVLFRQPPLR